MARDIHLGLTGEDRSRRAFDSAHRNLSRFNNGINSTLHNLSNFINVGKAGIAMVRNLAGSLNKAISAAETQARAEIQLGYFLAKNTRLTMESFKEWKNWASALQEATAVGDETTLKLAGLGAQMGKLAGDDLKRLTEGIIDLGVSSGASFRTLMISASRYIEQGSAPMLIRYGIHVENLADRTARINELIQKMSSGMAKAVGDLPVTGWRKLSNSFGDFVEALGFVITSTGSFQALVSWLKDMINLLNSALLDPKSLRQIVDTIDGIVISGIKMVSSIAASVTDAVGALVTFVENASREASNFIDEMQVKAVRAAGMVGQRISEAMGVAFSGSMFPELAKKAEKLQTVFKEMATIPDAPKRARVVNEEANAFSRAADSIREWAREAVDAIGKGVLMEDVFEKLIKRLQQLRPAAKKATEGLQMVSGMGASMQNIFPQYMGELMSRDTSPHQAMKNMGDAAANAFWTAFTQKSVEPFFQEGGFIDSLLNAITSPFNMLAKRMNQAIMDSLQFKKVFDWIGKSLSKLFDTLISKMGELLDLIWQGLKALGSMVLRLFGATIGGPAGAIAGTAFGGGGAAPGMGGAHPIPSMQHGGIVDDPTLALIGEAGPEAVIPLNDLKKLRGGITVNFSLNPGSLVLTDNDVRDVIERGARYMGELLEREFSL